VSDFIPLRDTLSYIVDNRGRTCPTSTKGMPLIATNCVKNSTLYPVFEKVRYVDDETYGTWFRAHPQPGDLIFVLKGSPGQVCLTPDPVNFCIAQDMVALRANPEVIDPSYLFAALRSPETQFNISNLHVGSLIAHFKKGDFDRLEIPLPNMNVQKEIGSFYLKMSEKIELNNQMSATLEDMARSLYRSWFVDFDPVHAKSEGRQPAFMDEATAALFPDRFGEDGLPEGWERGCIGDIAQLNPEKHTKKSHPNAVEYVDLSNTKWGIIETTTQYPWEEAPSRALMLLREQDKIVGTVRPGFGSYSYIGKDGLTGSTGFAVLRPTDAADIALVYLSATDTDTIDALANLADGGAYPAVRPDVVASQPVVLSSHDLRNAFQELVSPLIAKIEASKAQSQTLAALRDSLLPKLMSGELRVGEAREQVEELA
jgi:type I restriction enzyme S subunit